MCKYILAPLVLFIFLLSYPTAFAENNLKTEPNIMKSNSSLATFGGGCFWCVETIFLGFKGVEKVESGYAGGDVPNPTYEQVTSGKTNHAEVAQITFDPSVISYKDLVTIFFHAHDPTTLNRQGNDVGTQYRSIILYHDESQKKIAEDVLKEITETKLWSDKIVTELTPLDIFYVAEDYHQNYYANHKEKPYCSLVIAPKLQKVFAKFKDKLKEREPL